MPDHFSTLLRPNIQLGILSGFLAGAVAHDIRISRKDKKMAIEVAEENTKLHQQLERTNTVIRYLVYKIDESGIGWTEFDVIAINNAGE